MIKNHLNIAWRNLLRQKLYSVINISGLAIGLAVCMLIMLYVAHELSYDRFHKNAKRIYSLVEHLKLGEQEVQIEYTSYITAALIQQSVPEVEGYMRVRWTDKDVIVTNPQNIASKFSEKKMMYADDNFFSFFSFKLLSGDRNTVLNKPFTVVISQAAAKKYFGTLDVVGRTLTIKTDKEYVFEITGVAENVPSNSSVDFDLVTSNASLRAMPESVPLFNSQSIQGGAFKTYLLLKHPEDAQKVETSIQSLIKQGSDGSKDSMALTSLPDTHLSANFGDSSNIKYLKIFPLVATLILLLALVNYMSLSTARSTLRAKEVGVRKVSGASRKSIALQFFIESALYSIIAFILAYVICYTSEPLFVNLLHLRIDNSFLYSGPVLIILFILLILTILIAGSYPSIVLSAFNPAIILKGKMSRQAGGVTVRKIFTTLQFTISVALIICGIIIDRQLYYFRHTDTGVNRENIVMIPVSNGFGTQYQSFKKDIQALSGINSVATSRYAMYKGYDMFFIPGADKGQSITMPVLNVDEGFIPTLNIKWLQPPVPKVSVANGKKVIINEEVIYKLNLPRNPLGKFIDFGGSQKYEIAGVVKDFNYSSLASTIGPLCLFVASDTVSSWGKQGGCLFVKIKPHTNIPSLIEHIERIYKQYDKNIPFSFQFMDESFDQQYQAEDRLAAIFSAFTLITIFLATLGLFGLAAFTIEQRTKEIGIRKILGANVSGIAALLSTDFLKLVLLAILVASPIAWWSMHKWLETFAYRIAIQWWMFAGAALLAVIVASLTVSYHAIKAAISNPVNSLRND